MATPTEDNPEWLSTASAGRYLGLKSAAVIKLINDGLLRAYRPGHRSIRVRRSDLEAYLESRVIEPGSLSPATNPDDEDGSD